MTTVEKSIEVHLPVRSVYNQWTQFEEFPRFMEGVSEVHQLTDRRLHWKANVAGRNRESDARMTEQIPDERVAWTSMEALDNADAVPFYPTAEHEANVTPHVNLKR